jgi:predicted Fe-Mo cluster-binding NifX family protein
LADPEGTIEKHFGEAPYFGLVRVRVADQAVEEQRILGNPHLGEGKAKGIRVAEWLIAAKVDAVLLQEALHSKGPQYALSHAGVALQLTQASGLGAAVVGALAAEREQNTKGDLH